MAIKVEVYPSSGTDVSYKTIKPFVVVHRKFFPALHDDVMARDRFLE